MNKKLVINLFLCLVITSVLLVGSVVFAKPVVRSDKPASLAKAAVTDLETVDGNRIFNYINNLGAWCTHNNPVGFGMQWPGESGHSVNFASGVWVAGTVGGETRTAAAEFTYEFQPGHILPNGSPSSPDDANAQILKINKADLLDEGTSNPDYDLWINYANSLGAPVMKAVDGSDSLSVNGKRIPALIGDQILWMVFNDANPAVHGVLFQTSPIGLEVQSTVWTFNRPDEFGDMMFMKFLLVNKGSNDLEDAYIGLWFDIDMGDANDDLVFCDTTLSLGAFWNDGTDTDFDPPPAVGADFFQGPIVPSPGDTANISGVPFPGYKNLPMSSFAKYVRGGPPEAEDPENAQEAYNFMRGLNGLGEQILDNNGNVTKFVNVSDPETGTGWVDGVDLGPADRRMLMNTGPFTLDKWVDTNGNGLAEPGEPGVQEVVAGFMIAQGSDAKNSATRLKQMDEKAQLAYDLNFALPPSPPVPNITVHQLDQEIVLTWDRFSEDYQAIDRVSVDEEGNPTYYTFQGYNIYQLNTPNITPQTTITRLATYDLADGVKEIRDFVFSEEFGENVEATVQKGTDSGLTNHFRITADATRGGISLKNWQTYWFAITAYGYNPNGVPKTLESPTQTVEARPMPLQGGVSANTEYNDLIAFARPDTSHNATHTSAGAVSDGSVEVTVVDPAQVTGADYEVSFELKEGEVVWHLDRIDAGVKTRVLADQTNQSGDGAYLATDGLIVKILGPTPGINTNIPGPFGDIPGYNGWSSAGTRWVSWGTDWGGQTWNGSLGNGAGFFGSTLTAPDYVDVKLTWAGNTQENEPDRWSKGYLYRRDQGYGYAGLGDVPLSAWDNTNPASPRRLNVCFVEMNPMAAANNPDVSVEANAVWDMGWHEVPEDTGFATLGGREYLFIMRSDYDPSGNAYNDDNWGPGADVLYAMWPGPRGTNPYLAGDWEMEIFASKVNYVNDKFAFSTAGLSATSTQASAKTAAQKVNIFPNPYFGNNLMETNPIERFVTITHLPERGATIRIFSLAGDLVRTLNDADREAQGTLDTHVARWDLRNEFDVPVASAVYIIHVDMGTLGEKVLKAAVFMPEERLDKF